MGDNQFQLQPPTTDYADYEIFGSRYETSKLLQKLKIGNDSGCAIFAVGTFADKQPWKLSDLTGIDRRLRKMLEELSINHAFPAQQYCWPKMHNSAFPLLCVSPEKTGKTYTHLLYCVSQFMKTLPDCKIDEMLNGNGGYHFETSQDTDPEDFINHPKYIIVCSNQDQVQTLSRLIDHMKEKAYGIKAIHACRPNLPPVVRTINVHQDDDKLALRCNESEILIGTPPTLIRCFELEYIKFSRCKKVIFDDLDLALRLQHSNVRELIKIYMIQSQVTTGQGQSGSCQICLFSRKWTDLVGHFMSIFPQRILSFSSIAEASIYNNLKFEIERYEDESQKIFTLDTLINSLNDLQESKDKTAVVCNHDEEAEQLARQLTELGRNIKLMTEREMVAQPRSRLKTRAGPLVYVVSDGALEFELEFSTRRKPLNDLIHIVHASLPDDMLIFDTRFRLLYKNIQDCESGMTSTILVGPKFSNKRARQLYDLMSRSTLTPKSTKLMMRDIIDFDMSPICWRWATTGLCRLGKLGREDRFGSYCSNRHSFARKTETKSNRWPQDGQVKITITHIVSPNEFYFWFEAYRSLRSRKWTKFESTGINFMKKMQTELNKLKNTTTRSVPLNMIKKGGIYGVFFPQEKRVDRVLLLDEPKHEPDCIKSNQTRTKAPTVNTELEYGKQLPVVKVDYGLNLDIYIKNIIQLPESLTEIPPQCHRAFNLGIKPTDNEPSWLYKPKRHFSDIISMNITQETTAWLRLNRDNCFWFEGLNVSRRLSNIDSLDICSIEPNRDLCSAGLAIQTSNEPPGLMRSMRLETLCKWNFDKLSEVARYAFIHQEKLAPDIYVLSILRNFDVIVRQSKFNQQLINLENKIMGDYNNGILVKPGYFAVDVYCIAKIIEQIDSATKKPIFTLNRAKILKVHRKDDLESPDCSKGDEYTVECLDHGDMFRILGSCIYQAQIDHLTALPFQAVKCKFANLNQDLLSDDNLNRETRTLITDLVRTDSNDLISLKCRIDNDGKLYFYVPNEDATSFTPLCEKLLQKNIKLHNVVCPDFEKSIPADVEIDIGICRENFLNDQILSLLEKIAREELESLKQY